MVVRDLSYLAINDVKTDIQYPPAFTVEAEAVTQFLGFVDDVVIRVSEHDGITYVDMRSKSREGLVEAGKNAKRIARFFEGLRQSDASNLNPDNSTPTIISQEGALS